MENTVHTMGYSLPQEKQYIQWNMPFHIDKKVHAMEYAYNTEKTVHTMGCSIPQEKQYIQWNMPLHIDKKVHTMEYAIP